MVATAGASRTILGLRPRVVLAGLVALDVHAQHVGDAVRVDALEIGVDEHVGAAGGVGLGQPHPVENRLGDGAHVVGPKAHRLRL